VAWSTGLEKRVKLPDDLIHTYTRLCNGQPSPPTQVHSPAANLQAAGQFRLLQEFYGLQNQQTELITVQAPAAIAFSQIFSDFTQCKQSQSDRRNPTLPTGVTKFK